MQIQHRKAVVQLCLDSTVLSEKSFELVVVLLARMMAE